MKKFILVLAVTVISIGSMAQCSKTCCTDRPNKFIEAEYSRSLNSENVYGLEFGLQCPFNGLYASVSGRTFSAKRFEDNTTQVLFEPRIGYSFEPSNKFAVAPFAGTVYNYGGNENFRTSEWGPEFGIKAQYIIGNNGYIYIKSVAALTKNQLYTVGVGVGGFF